MWPVPEDQHNGIHSGQSSKANLGLLGPRFGKAAGSSDLLSAGQEYHI